MSNNIQASVNLLHYDSGSSVTGGGRRTAFESSSAINSLTLNTTPEAIPTGDIITPRYVAVKNYFGDDVLLSIDGGSTWPFRLSSDNDTLLIRLDFESHREVSTIVCEADTAGSLSGDYIVLEDNDGTVWAWFNIADPVTAVAEVSTITTVADVAGSLDGKYFVLYDDAGSVGVWFDVDNNGTTIPGGASACTRAIEITGVATGDSASTVASVLQAALDADAKFSASVLTNVVTVTNSVAGARTDLTAGDSTFAVAVTTQGVTGIAASTPPTPTTERLLQVDYYLDSTAAEIAVVLAAALDADDGFIAPVPTTATVTCTDQHAGTRANTTAGTTGWGSVTSNNAGSDYFDVQVKSAGSSKAAVGVLPN